MIIQIFFNFFILSVSNLLTSLDGDTLVAIITGLGGLITAYVLMKEKLVKNELKTENVISYIDSKIEVLTTEMNQMKKDIVEFKEINKETSRSMIENTSAVRELKLVLSMLRIQLYRDNKNIIIPKNVKDEKEDFDDLT